MSAEVVDFPARSCRVCIHFLAWAEGFTFAGRCQLFDRPVRDVHDTAERCSSYEPGGRHGQGQ